MWEMFCILKSDQNGIEMFKLYSEADSRDVLKSDQNGIEMHVIMLPLVKLQIIKIRPKWDWNFHPTEIFFSISKLLKSDQNGIEIFDTEGYQKNIRVLKSDQNGIEIILSHLVFTPLKVLKSDQNGIEICS